MNIASEQAQILDNVKAHDKVARLYQKIHGEIYNEVEQLRLHNALNKAKSLIETRSPRITALDFGCGAGNLTSHLLSLGLNVISSDVSPKFLNLIEQNFGKSELQTLLLNGSDLSNLDDNSVDMVATYSVLHHVPDYLSIIPEFMRVLRPGGILYIDHEVPESYWNNQKEITSFYKKARTHRLSDIKKYLRLTNYIDFLIRKTVNPRYRREGDIHVFHDDHIEWTKIYEKAQRFGALKYDESYLLFRAGYNAAIHDAWKSKISDMHLAIFQKSVNPSSK